MDPVYTDVKWRSTTYCVPFLGQAQDVDKGRAFFRTTYFKSLGSGLAGFGAPAHPIQRP
jgi:hypothetical protein